MLEFFVMLVLTVLASMLSMAITIFCGLKYIHAGSHKGYSDETKSFDWKKVVTQNWWETKDNSVGVSSLPAHFARFWWWMVTGLNLKQWAAVHRHNHLQADTKWANGKPESRLVRAKMYLSQHKNKELVEAYSLETPNTWIDRNLYYRLPLLGPVVYLLLWTTILGGWGVIVWLAQMAWVPVWCSESVNGYYLKDFEWNRLFNVLKKNRYYS